MARPRGARLTQSLIRDAALELIDRDGLEALSMRRLAESVGVQAASLYSHFSTKGEVLDAIANRIMADVDTSQFVHGWKPGVLAWARSYLAALEAHPNAVPIIASGAGNRHEFLAMANAVHGGLVGAGWPPRRATEISGAVKYLVIGAASTPFASGFADDTQVYLDRYPHLTQAHRLPADAARIDRDSFELGLTCLVAGLESQAPEPGGTGDTVAGSGENGGRVEA